MPVVLLDFSIYPLDKGESLSQYVARALEIVEASGLAYRLGPMGTTLEGEERACFAVVQDCFAELTRDCDRVSLQIRVDYRRGREGALTSKTASVERRLGRKLCT